MRAIGLVVVLLAVHTVVFALDLDRDVFDPESVAHEPTQFVNDLLGPVNRGLTVHDDVRRGAVAPGAERTDMNVVSDVDIVVHGQTTVHRSQEIVDELSGLVSDRFGIEHVTIQIECEHHCVDGEQDHDQADHAH